MWIVKHPFGEQQFQTKHQADAAMELAATTFMGWLNDRKFENVRCTRGASYDGSLTYTVTHGTGESRLYWKAVQE